MTVVHDGHMVFSGNPCCVFSKCGVIKLKKIDLILIDLTLIKEDAVQGRALTLPLAVLISGSHLGSIVAL